MKTFRKVFLFQILFVLFICLSTKVMGNEPNAKIFYTLSMPEPHTHYIEVEVKITNAEKISTNNKLQLKMASWTPGSYLIREYAKNVEGVLASANGNELEIKKINKNTWEINTKGFSEIKVSYKVYAFELTVRTSFIDDSHGYLNGASIFLYNDSLKNNEAELEIIPFKNWKTISTALHENSKNKFQIKNLDELIDSPIEIGNHEVIEFEAEGIPHKIAMYSNRKLEYDQEMVIDAYKKVIHEATSVVGEHPCQNYLFIIHHLPGIGGGLEHLNSTTCQTSPEAYSSEGRFRSLMGLIAHEYFHLWNVKRIRPIVLGPFDYENENYTTMLWVSEGFTSFYQDNLLKRANLITEEDYLKDMANDINSIENVPGNKIQSVAESSWDAWIKYYRGNENSNNATISYYSKGGVLGILLNLEIINSTNAKKSLDDVFRYLWDEFYKKKKRGYTDEEFQKACEKIAGHPLNDFFENYVNGTMPIDYEHFFNPAGIIIENTFIENKEPYFGAKINGTRVVGVERGTAAYDNGINVNDEILEVDGQKFSSISQILSNKKINDEVEITVLRSGAKFNYKVKLKQNPKVNFVLKKVDSMTEKQNKVYKKLMN